MNKFLKNEINKIFQSDDYITQIKHRKEGGIDILEYKERLHKIELHYKNNSLLNGFKTDRSNGTISEYITFKR